MAPKTKDIVLRLSGQSIAKEQRQNQFFSGMFLPESLCDMLCVILGLGKYFARACLISLKLGSNRHFGVNNFPVKNKLKT